jgi:hypothetical protein
LAGIAFGRLDEKGAAMNRLLPAVLLILLWPLAAAAHIGSSDVFFDGKVGPWPARITIRMPAVVPGRAEIITQVESTEPVTVAVTPLASRTAVSNAPPPEAARPVFGETNVFTGELWLMTFGAYSIDVRIHGATGDGDGEVLIPVNSAATAQLPLPPALGAALAMLGLILFFGAIAIVAAASSESTLPPGVSTGKSRRFKFWTAATVTGVVLVLALIGGKAWWNVEEQNFRRHLREGGWPDLQASVRNEGTQRILQLMIGKEDFSQKDSLDLIRDHGKLLHLFLVELPDHQAFGHIHPARKGSKTFEVALPPLPEGDYELYCDLTLESGLSSTATNTVHLPPMTASSTDPTNGLYLEADPDDSWATNSAAAVRENPGGETVCHLSDGTQVIWKAHPALQAKGDAGLQFEVRDANGQPVELEPYMGMMSHAAVMRSDGRVFAHLHPSGNFSMAAQMFFDAKMTRETGRAANHDNGGTNGDQSMMMKMPDGSMMVMDHSAMGPAVSSVSLPYEFPTAGDYRVWVQIKTGSEVKTAIFDTTVK